MTKEEFINPRIERVDGMLWASRGSFVRNAVSLLHGLKKENQIDEFSVICNFSELQSIQAMVTVSYRIGEHSYRNKYQLVELDNGYCGLNKHDDTYGIWKKCGYSEIITL